MKKNVVIATLSTAASVLVILAVFVALHPSSEKDVPDHTTGTGAEISPESYPTERITPPEETDGTIEDVATLEFERTVKLGEEFTITARFRDYSLLPRDFDDYESAVAQLPSMPGKVTVTFRKFEVADRITVMESSPGHTLNYVTYNYAGDPENPAGGRVVPSMPFDWMPDMAPQPVIVIGDQIFPVDQDKFDILRKALGLSHPTHMRFDQPSVRYYGAVWERPSGRLPVVAFAYISPDGERRLIRLDY